MWKVWATRFPFDGKTVTDTTQLKDVLSYYSAGETVDMTVYTLNTDGTAYTQTTISITLGGNAASIA